MTQNSGWFGVRCVFRVGGGDGDGGRSLFEERVTIWPAVDADDAIRQAETEAEDYARDIDAEYLGLAQCYTMADEVGPGAEVFSLIRGSTLAAGDYLDTHFDTGDERQTRVAAAELDLRDTDRSGS